MSERNQESADRLVAIAQAEIDRDRGWHALLRAWTRVVTIRHFTEWDQINQAMMRVAQSNGFENRSSYLYQNEYEEHVFVVYLFNPRASL